jgi:hypothetical protein
MTKIATLAISMCVCSAGVEDYTRSPSDSLARVDAAGLGGGAFCLSRKGNREREGNSSAGAPMVIVPR